MFCNNLPQSLYIIVRATSSEHAFADHVKAGKTHTFPDNWTACDLYISQDDENVVLRKSGAAVRLCHSGQVIIKTTDAGMITVSLNPRQILLVSNQTRESCTFWNGDVDSPKCTLVPAMSFLPVKNMSAVQDSSEDSVSLLNSTPFLRLGCSVLTFAPVDGTLYTSTVTIAYK